MKKKKKKNGFKFSVDETIIQDFDFVLMLAQARDEGGIGFALVVEKLLGSEQRKALVEYLRKETGTSTFEQVLDVTDEIIDLCSETEDASKN